ncbi:MAG: hypothetical protein Q9181_008360, partial [Wetmoreana brouardii]
DNFTICDDNTFCPIDPSSPVSSETCCNNHEGMTEISYHNLGVIPTAASALPDGVYKTATSSAATTSSTSASIGTATSSPTTTGISSLPSATSTSTPSSGLGGGAKAGIGAGIALGVIAITGIAIFIWKRGRRNLDNNDEKTMGGYNGNGYSGVPSNEPETQVYPKGELPADSARHELDAESPSQGRPHEMQS